MDAEGSGEYTLRIHIRQLLLNYAVSHLTADYIQLTEQAVTDVSRLGKLLPSFC